MTARITGKGTAVIINRGKNGEKFEKVHPTSSKKLLIYRSVGSDFYRD